jgi:hypothetical protein
MKVEDDINRRIKSSYNCVDEDHCEYCDFDLVWLKSQGTEQRRALFNAETNAETT